MINKIKKNVQENKTMYLIFFLLLLVFTGVFFYNRYAVDTYYLEGYGYKNNAFYPYLKDGRLIMTLFLGIMGTFDISFTVSKIISWLLATGSLFFSIIIIYNILNRMVKKRTLLKGLISFLLIVNIFVVEFFMFPEYTGVMCFSILLASLSTTNLVNFFETKSKRSLCFASFFSFLTAFCYQGTLSLLVLLPIVFTLKYSKDIKTFIKNNLSILLIYVIPAVTTLVVSKVLGSSRSSSGLNVSLAFEKIYTGAKTLLGTTFGILPNYFFLIISVVIFLTVLLLLIKNKEKLPKYLFYVYIMLAVIIVPLVPHMIVDAKTIWIVPRSNIGLGLLLVLPLLFYFLYLKENKKVSKFLSIIIIIVLVFQFKGWMGLVFDQVKVNALDRREYLDIVDKITEYEKDNEKITKVGIHYNKNKVFQYENTTARGDMNLRSMSIDWSAVSAISMYLHRSFEDSSTTNESKKACKDISVAEDEKNVVIFEKETMYVCTY